MALLDDLLKRRGAAAKGVLHSGAVKVKSGISNGIDSAVKNAKQKASVKHKTVKFEKLPQNAEEMKAMANFDQKDEYAVAAFTVAALLRFVSDQEDGKAMLSVLKGPEAVSNLELQMMQERLSDSDYLIRSYFKGAEPANDYKPKDPWTVEMVEYPNSRDIENYLYLYVVSGGADNPRQIQLRKKPSTGEWFIWVFQGLLMDIRIPVSEDKWA